MNLNEVAIGNIPNAGAMVLWRKRGDVTLEALKAAWAVQGLDEALLPHLPEPATALARALKTFEISRGTTRRRVEALKAGVSWELEERRVETPEAKAEAEEMKALGILPPEIPEGLKHRTLAKVKLNVIGAIVCEPKDWDELPILENRYRRALATLSTDDIGEWMVRMVRMLGGVCLLDQGGCYFLPADGLVSWEKMTAAIHACTSTQIFNPPCAPVDHVVRMVLSGLDAEIDTRLSAVEKEIDSGSLAGKKKTENRKAEMDALATRAESYRSLLGEHVTTLTQKVRKVVGTITELGALAEAAE